MARRGSLYATCRAEQSRMRCGRWKDKSRGELCGCGWGRGAAGGSYSWRRLGFTGRSVSRTAVILGVRTARPRIHHPVATGRESFERGETSGSGWCVRAPRQPADGDRSCGDGKQSRSRFLSSRRTEKSRAGRNRRRRKQRRWCAAAAATSADVWSTKGTALSHSLTHIRRVEHTRRECG